MINNLISFIENLKIEQMLLVFGIYLFFLWLLVPIWVYLDSRKKFENEWLPPLLFVLVLPLNIPGLLFYIIIRPEDDLFEEIADDHVVNIPIVNFVSEKNDLVFGFEIKLNGDIIKESVARDINLKVDLDHADTITFREDKKVMAKTNNGSGSFISNIKSKVTGILANLKKDSTEEKKETEVKKVEVKIGANTNNAENVANKPMINDSKPNTGNNNQTQHQNHQNNHQHNQNKPNPDKKEQDSQNAKVENTKDGNESDKKVEIEEKKA